MGVNIKGIDNMTVEEIVEAVDAGGRFVVYQWAVSVIFASFRNSTDILLVPGTSNRILKGLPWTLLTFVLGWWGIPWGPIYTVQSLWQNLSGGKDLTEAVLQEIMHPRDYAMRSGHQPSFPMPEA
ncbi:hypothetical protein [Erythrobacter donghaensis]|uniref:hypothetical protein n=1 Tax=Erythrobacter donghaensis TaxID=267135 RepID=UPI000A3C2283|nr:hypothetical protein [Erythrobacter donghaensis]